LLGAGGTASAVAYALVKNGAKDVLIHNRSPQRAEELVARIGSCRIGRQAELANDVEQAQIVINTTPVGFDPSGAGSKTESPIDVRLIKSHHIVLDAVYRPLETSLLAAAKKVGAKTVDGLEMLVHQAALQQEIWLGRRGDTKLMRDAALNTQ
jgi:shikimate dehydrogenase